MIRSPLAITIALGCSLLAACGDDETGTTTGTTTGATTCVDADGDGYGDLCEPGDDCDDSDADVFQSALGFTDADGDGYTTGGAAIVCSGASLPETMVATSMGDDCDDGDAGLFTQRVGFVDADSDSYGSGEAALVCSGSSLPMGYVGRGGDCDDATQTAFEQVLTYVDGDGDGLGGEPALICAGGDLPEGYASDGGDCDDGESSILACVSGCVDGDEDGYGDGCDLGADCDDGAGDLFQWTLAYIDGDGDHVGSADGATLVCAGESLGDGYADVGGDCDDGAPGQYQLAVGFADDDEDGVGAGDATLVCIGEDLPAGFVADAGDCDDDDGDNVASCSSCLDIDGDGYFHGCDAYETRQGPDCQAYDVYRYQWLDGYRDRDGDSVTVGEAVALCTGEELPSPYIVEASDADDCNDFADDLYRTTDLYLDLDDDGVAGDEVAGVCYGDEPPEGFVSTDDPGVDCEDMDPDRYQLLMGFSDWDDDGYTLSEGALVCAGAGLPDGFWPSASGLTDCNDLADSVNPGAEEIPGDLVDQDCSEGDPLPTNSDGYFADDSAACDGAGTIESPYCDIGDAIDDAVRSGGAVYVATGDYELGVDLTVDIVGGFNGTFTAQDDGGDTVLFVDSGTAPVIRVLGDETVTLVNVTLDSENVDAWSTLDNYGDLTLWNVSIDGPNVDRDHYLVINRPSGILHVYDSVLANSYACTNSFTVGLYNDGWAYLANATIEGIFSSTGGNAAGIYSTDTLIAIDSSVSVGSAETITGIASTGTMILRNTDVEMAGGSGCDANTDDILGAWGVYVYDGPYDIEGGEITATHGVNEAYGVDVVEGGEYQRLVGVTMNVGSDADGYGVRVTESDAQLVMTDNDITVSGPEDAFGVTVESIDYLVGENHVTLTAGDGVREGFLATGELSGVLHDNTLTIGASTGARIRGVNHDGPLLAVDNRIELAVTSMQATGLDSDVEPRQSLYFNQITILGAEADAIGVRTDRGGLIAVRNEIEAVAGRSATGIIASLDPGDRALIDGNTVEVLAGSNDGISIGGGILTGTDVVLLNNTVGPAAGDVTMRAFDAIDIQAFDANVVLAHNTLNHGRGGSNARGIQTGGPPASTYIYDNEIVPGELPSSGDILGIRARGQFVVVEANRIATGETDNQNMGLDLGDGGLAINNVIHVGAGDETIGVRASSAALVELVDNTIYGGDGSDGESGSSTAVWVGLTRVVLVGNILIPGTATSSVGVDGSDATFRVVVDNVIWGSDMTLVADIDGTEFTSVIDLETDLRRSRRFAEGNLSADPLLVDFPGDDFHLTEGSPAIDAATTVIYDVYEDLDGDSRPFGGVDDIGADEYVSVPE